MRLTVLGCGGSSGVPLVTGRWGACDPNEPKNRRTRTSLAIELPVPLSETGIETWLIDTGPDLRAQLLRENIQRVHGLFITHAHADHVLGLNDLRPFFGHFREKIPFYADVETLKVLKHLFVFLIDDAKAPPPRLPIYKPFLVPKALEPTFRWHNWQVQTFGQDHGGMNTMGYRFDCLAPQGASGKQSWAYSTDVKTLSKEALSLLHGVDIWFVDCMDLEPRPTHAHLEQTLAWIDAVRPKHALLIHMGAKLDYQTLTQQLKKHPLVTQGAVQSIAPAYDGLCLSV